MTVEESVADQKEEQKSVLVGIGINGDGGEVIDWALSKIAEPGDVVVALHFCRRSDSYKDNSLATLCSLDGHLAIYESFCNLKKINLVGKILQGNSIQRILVREAKQCNPKALILGISECNALGVSLSVAKYCAKKLPSTTILGIHEGKVVFQKNASKLFPGDLWQSIYSSLNPSVGGVSKVVNPNHKEVYDFVLLKGAKVGYFAPLTTFRPFKICGWVFRKNAFELELAEDSAKTDETEAGRLSSPALKNVNDLQSVEPEDGNFCPIQEPSDEVSSSISPVDLRSPNSSPGWPLLQKRKLEYSDVSRKHEARKMSVVQWVMTLPDRSLPPISLPQIVLETDRRKHHESSDGKSARSSLSAWLELPRELELMISTNSAKCAVFTLKEIQSSITQFTPENLIGKGGCSQVYKGNLPNGQPVAVKRSKSSKKAWKDFLLEVDILTSVKHKHITPLIGICVEDNYLISIYKFLSRGSLEENLHGKADKTVLPWKVRFKVAVGVAEALNYLHSGCSSPIIHRDVKTSNVLLSDDFEPQLSDFGLALWAPTTAYVTYSGFVGTFGYLAPEYFMSGRVSVKIDIYSYGVVLLELLTGRKPIDAENPKGQQSLVMWATPKLENGCIADLLDPNLGRDYDENQMRRMVLAATLCVSRTAQQRPEMSQILKLLQGLEEVVEWAKSEVIISKGIDLQDEEAYPIHRYKPHIDLKLLEEDDDTAPEQKHRRSLEDYLKSRRSRSSSFY